MRFAICDDDTENLQYMKEQICVAFEKNCDKEELDISVFSTGRELIEANIAAQVDVVFMDIELENNSLGFDVARRLCEQRKNIPIVYMTNHDHYVTKSFVCRPLGFVRKHYAKEDLDMVMKEVMRYLREEYKVMTFYNNTKTVELYVNEIYAVEVFNHELVISLANKKSISIRDSFSGHINELEENGFVLARRGVAVNAKYIKELEGFDLTLSNGVKYSVGRDHINKVKQRWLDKRYL